MTLVKHFLLITLLSLTPALADQNQRSKRDHNSPPAKNPLPKKVLSASHKKQQNNQRTSRKEAVKKTKTAEQEAEKHASSKGIGTEQKMIKKGTKSQRNLANKSNYQKKQQGPKNAVKSNQEKVSEAHASVPEEKSSQEIKNSSNLIALDNKEPQAEAKQESSTAETTKSQAKEEKMENQENSENAPKVTQMPKTADSQASQKESVSVAENKNSVSDSLTSQKESVSEAENKNPVSDSYQQTEQIQQNENLKLPISLSKTQEPKQEKTLVSSVNQNSSTTSTKTGKDNKQPHDHHSDLHSSRDHHEQEHRGKKHSQHPSSDTHKSMHSSSGHHDNHTEVVHPNLSKAQYHAEVKQLNSKPSRRNQKKKTIKGSSESGGKFTVQNSHGSQGKPRLDDKTIDKFLQNFESELEQVNPFQLIAEILDEDSLNAKESTTDKKKTFFDISNATEDTKEIQLMEDQQVGLNQVLFKLTEEVMMNQFLTLTLTGTGVLRIDVLNEEKQTVKRVMGTVSNEDMLIKKKVLIDTFFLRHDQNCYLKFSMQTMILGESMKIRMAGQEYFSLVFGHHLQLDTQFTHTLNLKIRFPKDHKMNFKSRIQFILKTNLISEDFDGDEELEMFINFNKDKQDSRWDMTASGSIGNGLIKTVNSESKFFPQHHDEFYFVQIKMKGIKEIIFLASVFNNGSKIKLSKTLKLLEEIEVGEVVLYELEIERKKNTKILFTLQPTLLETTLYINPDKRIKNLEDIEYVTSGKGNQAIMITEKQLNEFNYTGKTFFIAFDCKDKNKGSTFSFSVSVVPEEEEMIIDEDYFVSGVIIREEIVNYYMNLFSGESETFDILFKVTYSKKDVELMIKECKPEEKNCQITEADFKEYKTYNDRIFLFSKLKRDENFSHLKFNCFGHDPFEINSKFHNNFPSSVGCKFAIGVYSAVDQKDYVPYTMEIEGKSVIRNLPLGISNNIIVYPNEEKAFHYRIKESQPIIAIYFIIVALSGDCTIYFSSTDSNPGEKNHEVSVAINNTNLSSIQVKNYKVKVPLRKKTTSGDIFMNISASEYTIVDIYSEVVGNQEQLKNWLLFQENLSPNKLVLRSISRKEYYQDSVNSKDIYFKNFRFKFPKNFIGQQNFNVTVNSKILGLHICIQKNQKEFIFEKPCDWFSSTENAEVTFEPGLFQTGVFFAISVQKIVDSKEEIFTQFPIDFDILVHSKVKHNKVELIFPSQINTKKIDSQGHINFEIDLTLCKEKATILFTTHFIDVHAIVQTNLKINQGQENGIIHTLDFSNYGLIIENMGEFKNQFCKNIKCFLYLIIVNNGLQNARFSITFSLDDIPIMLKEGEQIFLPSHQEIFLFALPSQNKVLSFNYENTYYESVSYAKIVELDAEENNPKRLQGLLTDENFDYKSTINKKGNIVMEKEAFEYFRKPVVLFKLVPKFNLTKERMHRTFTVLNEEDKTKVSLDFSLVKLNPYSETQGVVMSGQFKYYHFIIDKIQNMTIFLNVHNGYASMFLNKGFKNLPNEHNFWLKSDGISNSSIEIKADLFETAHKMKDSFTLGVYGLYDASYSLIMVESDNNLFNVEFQKVLSMEIQQNKMYFFDYFNVHKKLNLMIYSDKSDLEISIIKYAPLFGEGFLDVIKNESHVIKNHVFKQGSPPWTFSDQSIFDLSLHFLIRVRAIEMHTQFDMAIYNSEHPLEISSNKKTFFSLPINKTQVFSIELHNSFREADVQVKLDSGSLIFSISDSISFEKENVMDFPSQKKVTFQDLRKKQPNDILIFNKVFIKVTAKALSNFSIQVKPRQVFQELRPFEGELIKTSTTDPSFLYFSIDKKNVNKFKNLKIDLQYMTLYESQVEFLFNSNDDVQLEAGNVFLPMPILSQIKSTKVQEIHQTIFPASTSGYFIIKLPKTEKPSPVMISFSFNDKKQLKANDSVVERFTAGQNNKDYFVYIPDEGEFRILTESCSKIRIEEVNFENQKVNIEPNLIQEYQFFSKEIDSKEYEVDVMKVPVVRVLNEKAGVAKFSIRNEQGNADNHFAIVTEYRPMKKGLILKDYIDYYPMIEEHFQHGYIKSAGKTSLLIRATLPQFKDQFFQDYPTVKVIKLDYFVYLIPDKHFVEAYKKCGKAALSDLNFELKTETVLLKFQQNSKNTVDLIFNESQISEVRSSEFLTVFAQLKVTLLRGDQEDEFTFDQKVAEIPFFTMVIQNEQLSLFSFFLQKVQNTSYLQVQTFLALLLCLLLLIFCCKVRSNRKRMKTMIRDSKQTYTHPDHKEPTPVLEMT